MFPVGDDADTKSKVDNMTTTAEQTEKQTQKEALKAREKDMTEREKKLNEGRTGKGTRVFLGMTRGRNPQEIQYEAFDDAQPETLPTSLTEFMDLSKINDEKQIVSFLIDGFNSASYTAASDPVAEFVDASWDTETQKQFRTVVRNYASATGTSIEDAVALIKPGIIAAQEKAKASATA